MCLVLLKIQESKVIEKYDCDGMQFHNQNDSNTDNNNNKKIEICNQKMIQFK